VLSIFILIGPPGVGKGTQGDLLSKKADLLKLATGDLFREEAGKDTDLGRKVRGIMNSGSLVPDEVVVEMVRERLRGPAYDPGCIFDGFPRTIRQAELLDDLLRDAGKKVDRVVSLAADDDELVKRLSGRRVCQACNSLFNIYYNAPKRDDQCDLCGGALYQREDDREDTIRARLNVYHEQTRPLIDFYDQRGLLSEVDGTGTVSQIQDRILSELGL
jgi:adenylate kinase